MSEGRINVVGISDVGSVEIPLEDRGLQFQRFQSKIFDVNLVIRRRQRSVKIT
ncbi:hypothetical protein DPMN_016591 [Dreissena polymorpha]|uniref:Uncharacterized protein n=1 Tax=Dreissena polymorpha TaxID=45954 RepID=A0A9D4N9Z2_DREPO|nr:hypothetical protein DPMN_016591 [Dreissena polymorpha]